MFGRKSKRTQKREAHQKALREGLIFWLPGGSSQINVYLDYCVIRCLGKTKMKEKEREIPFTSIRDVIHTPATVSRMASLQLITKEMPDVKRSYCDAYENNLVVVHPGNEELAQKIRHIMLQIPNIIDPSVPIGPDDSANVEVQRFGEPVTPDFDIPYHTQIMESFNGIDMDAAGRVSGPVRNIPDPGVNTRHPPSCAYLPGFQIPFWPVLTACVRRAMDRVPGMGYVGWDIAVTPDGPELIEGNWHWPGGNIIQFDGVGKYPLLRDCAGETDEEHPH